MASYLNLYARECREKSESRKLEGIYSSKSDVLTLPYEKMTNSLFRERQKSCVLWDFVSRAKDRISVEDSPTIIDTLSSAMKT